MLSEPCNRSIFNGVKQGGVLSPILYSIYVDDFIKILWNKCIIGVGITMNKLVIFT